MAGVPTRATIREVAALAGVGIKTVSRVINEEPHVSEATRSRVQYAINALNFTPHEGAGALRRSVRRHRAIGLVLDAVDNPFSAAINRAVEVLADEHEVAVFAASSDDSVGRERALVATFLRRRVDGIVMTSIDTDHGYLRPDMEHGLRVVFVDRPPVGLVADTVVTNNAEASAMGVGHLLRHGHTRVAYLGDDPRISTAGERRTGFDLALAAHGLAAAGYRDDLRSAEAAEQAAAELLDRPEPPTALFTAQNLVTIGVVRALHRRGLQDRVAVVGFDDLPLGDLIRPGISVIAQDVREIGTQAARLLLAEPDPDRTGPQRIVVPARLIARGSGELPPPSR